MKRIVLTATALLLLATAATTSASIGPAIAQRHERQILVRGIVVAVSPIKVRASIGATITCEVRDAELVATLVVGDHVRMKCIAVDGRLVLRRLAINPAARPQARAAEPPSERPLPSTSDRARGAAG